MIECVSFTRCCIEHFQIFRMFAFYCRSDACVITVPGSRITLTKETSEISHNMKKIFLTKKFPTYSCNKYYISMLLKLTANQLSCMVPLFMKIMLLPHHQLACNHADTKKGHVNRERCRHEICQPVLAPVRRLLDCFRNPRPRSILLVNKAGKYAGSSVIKSCGPRRRGTTRWCLGKGGH